MPSKQHKISLGCDPEIFLKNKTTHKFVSAHTLIPGTKEEPFPVPNGAIQVDGVAAEFNIKPASSMAEWLINNECVINEIRNRTQGYDLVFEPTANFDKRYFKSLPDEVKELGCKPDWNAWTGELNPKPDGDSVTYRTGAGHIHLGWTKNADILGESHVNDCHIVVRHMDYYLGLMSMMWDDDVKRRTLYGRAGAHRRKLYGVEYRTLSNRWLSSKALMEYVYHASTKCIQDIFKGVDLEAEYKNTAQVVIDNNIKWWDIEELQKNKSKLPKGVDLKRFNIFYKFIGLIKPLIPEKPKKDPNYKYNGSKAV